MTAECRSLGHLSDAQNTLKRLLNGVAYLTERVEHVGDEQLRKELSKGVSGFAVLINEVIENLLRYNSIVQTDFSQWLRSNPELDSIKYGLSIHDVDWIIHQFLVREDKNGPRRFNNLMLIEEKRFGRQPNYAQSDTLTILNQVMSGGNSRRMVTDLRGRTVLLRYYGLHTLTFSDSGPLDSKTIAWDGKSISVPTLEQLIRFEVHPQTLRPLDTSGRRHHANKAAATPLFAHMDSRTGG